MTTLHEPHAPLVYYARRRDLIKIGTTSRIHKRMAQQKMDELLAAEPGYFDLESERHSQFAADRVVMQRLGRNDWFRLSATLLEHVRELRTVHGIPERPRGWEPEAVCTERWLPVPGYEDCYAVSDLGRVRSLSRPGHPGRLLNPFPTGEYGYLAVGLWQDNKGATTYVHRLVADNFIGPLLTGQVTRHGPGGHLDNRLSNLKQGSQAENVDDMMQAGNHRHGIKNPFAKLTEEQVADIRRRVAAGETQKAAGLRYGVGQPNVSMLVRNKTWTRC